MGAKKCWEQIKEAFRNTKFGVLTVILFPVVAVFWLFQMAFWAFYTINVMAYSYVKGAIEEQNHPAVKIVLYLILSWIVLIHYLDQVLVLTGYAVCSCVQQVLLYVSSLGGITFYNPCAKENL